MTGVESSGLERRGQFTQPTQLAIPVVGNIGGGEHELRDAGVDVLAQDGEELVRSARITQGLVVGAAAEYRHDEGADLGASLAGVHDRHPEVFDVEGPPGVFG